MKAGSSPESRVAIVNESSIIWFEVLVLPPGHTGARDARDFVGAHLAIHGLPYLVDEIHLVVSELVTNALVHGQPPVIVAMEERERDVLVTVSDESPVQPGVLRHEATDVGGRGLSIVEQVSQEWGTNNRFDGGKSVWARFDKETRDLTPATSQGQPV